MSATANTPKPETRTAKLFKNGRSQAVRLPKEFRFEGTEVSIRRDAGTGEVILTPPPASPPPSEALQAWLDLMDSADTPDDLLVERAKSLGKLTPKELMQVLDKADFPEDFMADRKTQMPRERDLF